MIVQYYKNKDLSYSSRKRYKRITLTPLGSEYQRAILLGDGAETSVKTKVSNICDYVIMTDNYGVETRWFVTSYIYLNGGQVKLFLQRDVIGEKGLDNCYGKIERGFTDTILKRRKELDVNQILKSRKYLQPNTMQYGNLSVNTHDNEMWGILYLVKPTSGEDKVNINIPGFSPKVDEALGFIEQQTNLVQNLESVSLYEFNVLIYWDRGGDAEQNKWYYKCSFRNRGQTMVYTYERISGNPSNVSIELKKYNGGSILVTTIYPDDVIKSFCDYVYTKINSENNFFEIAHNIEVKQSYANYNNKTILHNDVYYNYNIKETTVTHYFKNNKTFSFFNGYDTFINNSGYFKSTYEDIDVPVYATSYSYNNMLQ